MRAAATWLAVAALAVAAVALAVPPPGPAPVRRIDTADVGAYATASDLAAGSDLVVRGVPTGALSHELVGGVPFTISDVRVAAVLAGGPSVAMVRVRQVGGPGVETPHSPPLVPGRTYVLFLRRFAYAPDRPTDQYVVTGGGRGAVADP